MKKTGKEILVEGRRLWKNGSTVDQLIVFLHEQGLNIGESMSAVKLITSIPFGDAKIRVSSHKIWKELADSNRPLQELSIEVLLADSSEAEEKN